MELEHLVGMETIVVREDQEEVKDPLIEQVEEYQ